MDTAPLLHIRLDQEQAKSLVDALRGDPVLAEQLRFEAAFRQSGGASYAVIQILSVALGSGGVGAVLAGALSTWLSQRTSDVELTISEPNGRRVEVDAHRVRDTPELLRQIAQMLDGTSPDDGKADSRLA